VRPHLTRQQPRRDRKILIMRSRQLLARRVCGLEPLGGDGHAAF
jgi:hypothetical protein